MQPVEPSTIVRGPAALTMCRITSADSHPWQVRWPETKSSSYGTSLTPLIGGRVPVPCVSTAIIASLVPHADPVSDVTGREAAAGGHRELVEHLAGHRLLDLTAAEGRDEADDRRAPVDGVHRRADLVVEHAAVVRGTEAVVAVDDPDGPEPAQALHDVRGGERPEPLEPDEADLVALLAELADGDLHRQRQGALTDEHHFGVVGHVLIEERVLAAAAEQPLEVGVRLGDDVQGLAHGLVVLHPDLHEPVLVDLWGDGDLVVRMEEPVAEVEL